MPAKGSGNKVRGRVAPVSALEQSRLEVLSRVGSGPEPGLRFNSREEMVAEQSRLAGLVETPDPPQGGVDGFGNEQPLGPVTVNPSTEGLVIQDRLVEQQEAVLGLFVVLEKILKQGVLPRRELLAARALKRYLIGESDTPSLWG